MCGNNVLQKKKWIEFIYLFIWKMGGSAYCLVCSNRTIRLKLIKSRNIISIF